MINIHLTSADLAGMRFVYSPYLEIPLSYLVLTNPTYQTLYLRWVDKARHALHDVQLPYLSALVEPTGYIPNFLTPTPMGNRLNIEDDFEDILATPDEIIQRDILALIADRGDSEMRRYFLAYPREAVACLVEEMQWYWSRLLSPYLSRLMATVDGDILYRGRLLAMDGPGSLLEDLHPSISFRDNQVQIKPILNSDQPDLQFQLRGKGIQLVPMVFLGRGRSYQLGERWHPMLLYRARGTGLWYQKPPSQSLEAALGTARAQVLQALITPSSTTEVSHKLSITAATVSQHLARLMKAGLVIPRRSGKCVYYHLTKRGEDVIALFERMD
jgi:DNA-binding MarR family transcriptional regulator